MTKAVVSPKSFAETIYLSLKRRSKTEQAIEVLLRCKEKQFITSLVYGTGIACHPLNKILGELHAANFLLKFLVLPKGYKLKTPEQIEKKRKRYTYQTTEEGLSLARQLTKNLNILRNALGIEELRI